MPHSSSKEKEHPMRFGGIGKDAERLVKGLDVVKNLRVFVLGQFGKNIYTSFDAAFDKRALPKVSLSVKQQPSANKGGESSGVNEAGIGSTDSPAPDCATEIAPETDTYLPTRVDSSPFGPAPATHPAFDTSDGPDASPPIDLDESPMTPPPPPSSSQTISSANETAKDPSRRDPKDQHQKDQKGRGHGHGHGHHGHRPQHGHHKGRSTSASDAALLALAEANIKAARATARATNILSSRVRAPPRQSISVVYDAGAAGPQSVRDGVLYHFREPIGPITAFGALSGGRAVYGKVGADLTLHSTALPELEIAASASVTTTELGSQYVAATSSTTSTTPPRSSSPPPADGAAVCVEGPRSPSTTAPATGSTSGSATGASSRRTATSTFRPGDNAGIFTRLSVGYTTPWANLLTGISYQDAYGWKATADMVFGLIRAPAKTHGHGHGHTHASTTTTSSAAVTGGAPVHKVPNMVTEKSHSLVLGISATHALSHSLPNKPPPSFEMMKRLAGTVELDVDGPPVVPGATPMTSKIDLRLHSAPPHSKDAQNTFFCTLVEGRPHVIGVDIFRNIGSNLSVGIRASYDIDATSPFGIANKAAREKSSSSSGRKRSFSGSMASGDSSPRRKGDKGDKGDGKRKNSRATSPPARRENGDLNSPREVESAPSAGPGEAAPSPPPLLHSSSMPVTASPVPPLLRSATAPSGLDPKRRSPSPLAPKRPLLDVPARRRAMSTSAPDVTEVTEIFAGPETAPPAGDPNWSPLPGATALDRAMLQVACAYKVEKDSRLKGRIDSRGNAAVSLQMRFRPHVQIELGATLAGSKIGDPAALSVGMGIKFVLPEFS